MRGSSPCTSSARCGGHRGQPGADAVRPPVGIPLALTLFGVGSVGCAVAPTMEIMLVGRTVQGAAGGLLAGLGTRSSTPLCRVRCGPRRRLWYRRCGVSASSSGPRWAVCSPNSALALGFRVLAILTVAMAVLVPSALPARGETTDARGATGFRCGHCCCWARRRSRSAWRASRARPSTAGLLAWARTGRVIPGVDRRAQASVLPPGISARPVEMDVPDSGLADGRHDGRHVCAAFGQRLAHLAPVAAGFLGRCSRSAGRWARS